MKRTRLMHKYRGYTLAAVAILSTLTATPGFASSITVALGGGATTATPGQLISDSPNPDSFEEGLANYGLVRALSASSSPSGDAVAASQFDVDFMLSGDATLAIGYHYDVNLVLDYPGAASYKFGIATTSTANHIVDAGGTAWTYLAIGNTTGGMGDDHADACPEFAGLQAAGTCAFHHEDTGVLTVPFSAGPNHLEVALFTGAVKGGTSDGFHTGLISGITVPDGITFTYSDLSGNPLNVHAASAVPEPASWVLSGTAFSLMGFLLARRRRAY